MEVDSEADSQNDVEDNPEARLQLRLDYRSIIDDLNSNRKDYLSLESDALEKKIDDCNRVFERVRMPREGVLDASALRTITTFANMRIRQLDEKGSLENAYAFAQKCKKVVDNMSGGWSEFYEIFSQYHKVAPSMNFMSGRLPTTFFATETLEKLKNRKKQIREPKQTKEDLEKSRTVPEEMNQFGKEVGEQTLTEILRIKSILVKSFKENKGQPFDYFEFVVHPESFARTVENMFHISFLIKEGYARLFLDKEELPAIEPTEKALFKSSLNSSTSSQQRSQNSTIHSNQMIMSFTVEDWEEVKKTFEIVVPMIPDK
ncbi:unnamed protein product [Didymodactylos carnosus]|uniref:Non-structural maintenance of chromosomes element 4 n=1 Tax=Didymodactylos carnosus TaxID=1234261 RepID=A0A8S2DWC8_9BILA|nr:unnamed protein product [Didymodactylos carnosus]CAF3762590.1 unnamed protein product [Didymodactylos carnosus]